MEHLGEFKTLHRASAFIRQNASGIREVLYREVHLLANFGWVDFDFGCSTLCLVLPGLMGNWQNWLSSWARWCNIPNQELHLIFSLSFKKCVPEQICPKFAFLPYPSKLAECGCLHIHTGRPVEEFHRGKIRKTWALWQDLRCIQCDINHMTLDAPKISYGICSFSLCIVMINLLSAPCMGDIFLPIWEPDKGCPRPEIYSEEHTSSIFRQSSNPVCGFSNTEQVRLCAVWTIENWHGSSMNHIKGWRTVWICYWFDPQNRSLPSTPSSIFSPSPYLFALSLSLLLLPSPRSVFLLFAAAEETLWKEPQVRSPSIGKHLHTQSHADHRKSDRVS